MATLKCKNCGSTDVEEDNTRGDAVCTNCGSVLEDNLIVSEVQYEEVGHGASTVGQFVAIGCTGAASNYAYGKFQVAPGAESREVTIKRAKKGISILCDQLQLSSHYVETALNFFKLALLRNLTKGRKNTHVNAACVYITCRINETSHLLIDISDVLQICCYELGRTYLKLSQALCIKIPSIDPCLYIMRFANKLEFGDKTHDVATTALRVVQRMKKDSIHSGRRPTGLCGAALLIAARMHEFSRTIMDLVKVVKIHESTLRKRLIEFADTPSSSLTLDEFMMVDLEAEQDPPAFKVSRKKDKERIQKIVDQELTDLQREIDYHIRQDLPKNVSCNGLSIKNHSVKETDICLEATSMQTIKESLIDKLNSVEHEQCAKGLKPDIAAICSVRNLNTEEVSSKMISNDEGELNLEDLDDDEINGYIMTEDEARSKNEMWSKLNCVFLDNLKSREQNSVKENDVFKQSKKKKSFRINSKTNSNVATGGGLVEKMLQNKKISNKINYEILRILAEPVAKVIPMKNEFSNTKVKDLQKLRTSPEVWQSSKLNSFKCESSMDCDSSNIVQQSDSPIEDEEVSNDIPNLVLGSDCSLKAMLDLGIADDECYDLNESY